MEHNYISNLKRNAAISLAFKVGETVKYGRYWSLTILPSKSSLDVAFGGDLFVWFEVTL